MDLNELRFIADMLLGCKNRMFLTDSEEELIRLYAFLSMYASQLYTGHLARVRKEERD